MAETLTGSQRLRAFITGKVELRARDVGRRTALGMTLRPATPAASH